jgi:hypothetical protein
VLQWIKNVHLFGVWWGRWLGTPAAHDTYSGGSVSGNVAVRETVAVTSCSTITKEGPHRLIAFRQFISAMEINCIMICVYLCAAAVLKPNPICGCLLRLEGFHSFYKLRAC